MNYEGRKCKGVGSPGHATGGSRNRIVVLAQGALGFIAASLLGAYPEVAIAAGINDVTYTTANGTINSNQQTDLGVGAGGNNSGNTGDVDIGEDAGFNMLGSDNSVLGAFTGFDLTGNENTGLGYFAGSQVTGNGNSSIGTLSGENTTGNNNTAEGFQAVSLQKATETSLTDTSRVSPAAAVSIPLWDNPPDITVAAMKILLSVILQEPPSMFLTRSRSAYQLKPRLTVRSPSAPVRSIR
jgi:hypothetical protein